MSRLLLIALLAIPAAPLAAQPGRSDEEASDPRSRIVCRREIDTGSHIRGRRVCKTVRQWQREGGIARDELNSLLTASPGQSGN